MSTPRLLKIIVCTADGKEILDTRYTDEYQEDISYVLDTHLTTFDTEEEYRKYGGLCE